MKQVQHLFLVVLFSVFSAFILKAQTTSLPNISSQYLTQGNDYGAVVLNIQYTDSKSAWVLDGKTFDFTQQNLYQFLDAQFKKLDAAAIQQSNLKLEAPTDMPIHYLQDAYVWIQVYGNHSLHLAMYESMAPNKKQFLSLDILPFTHLEEACKHYATSTNSSSSTIETFATIHPNTEHLDLEKKIDLSLTQKTVQKPILNNIYGLI